MKSSLIYLALVCVGTFCVTAVSYADGPFSGIQPMTEEQGNSAEEGGNATKPNENTGTTANSTCFVVEKVATDQAGHLQVSFKNSCSEQQITACIYKEGAAPMGYNAATQNGVSMTWDLGILGEQDRFAIGPSGSVDCK